MIRRRLSHLLRRLRPVVRRVLLGVLWVLLAVTVVLVVGLGLPPGREALLRRGLQLADGTVPGTMQVTTVSWPRLGRLSLAGIRWSDGDTLLASLDTLAVAVDLSALRQRDLVVDDVRLSGARLDWPAIQRRLPTPAAPAEPPPADADPSPPPFPRPGALPPVPSLALHRLDVHQVAVALAPDQTVRLDTLRAGLELRHGHMPAARLDLSARPWGDLGVAWRLELTARGDTLTAAVAPITVVPADSVPASSALPLAGRIAVLRSDLSAPDSLLTRPLFLRLRDLGLAGVAGRWTINGRLDHDGRGQIALAGRCPRIPWTVLPDSLRATTWADTLQTHWHRLGGPSADLALTFSPATGGDLPWDASLAGHLDLPGPAALAPLAPPQLDLADLLLLAADIRADYRGGQARARLDLGRTPWLDQALIVAHGDTTQARLDTLDLALPGLRATARGGFSRQRFDLDADVALPDAGLLRRWRDPALADLELAARLQIQAQGAPTAPTARLQLQAETPDAAVDLAGHLAGHDLEHSPRLLSRLDSLAVRVADHWLRTTAPCTLAVNAADSSLTVTGLAMAGDLGTLDLTASATPDSVLAALGLELQVALQALQPWLPPDVQALVPTGAITLSGRTDVHGPLTMPAADGQLRLGFADNPDLARLSAAGQLSLSRHLNADLAILDTDTALVRLLARAPRPGPGAAPDTVDIILQADGTDLGRLAPLLPPGVGLTGTLSADPRVVGLLDLASTETPDLDLSGGLDLPDLRLALPDGSWLAMAGQAGFSGTTLAPVVQGGLRIEGGLLRVPEPPPILLPDKGQALLWQEYNNTRNGTDTPTAPADSTEHAAPAILPELDLRLEAPGGLWIRGQGLDVELAGDLSLRLRGGLPAIEGELQAVQGTMRQLGHVFHLERGRVVFYADEGNLDPELDLVLAVKVDGVAVSIVLSGTANQPNLDLTSDAGLSHGDIMALLLFGKTSDELDDGQSGFLAQRAAQLAAASGSVALQEKLAQELGADVLTIAPSEDRDDATSLTLGKYLSPRVLVRYEQLLSEESAFYVHLDYTLVQNLKLHTQVSQGEASGAALRWEKSW